jgi:2-polyprenyl-6-methoxyphenol hydroxylase-like FAD-dependent oxidoreductase
LEQAEVDEHIRQYVQQISGRRAPWFTAPVKQVTWCTEVAFEPCLAEAFGRGRCWLAGDAAHQTGPVGVQSMNQGFWEADVLAGQLRQILRHDKPLASLAAYERDARAEWRRLLGLTGGLRPRSDTLPWVRGNSARLLPCLPSAAGDLDRLAGQLNLDLK